MKKYSAFNLYVIKINKKKFICECIIPGEKYREILTGRKIDLKDKYVVEKLSDYYSILEVVCCKENEMLRLTKDNILSKYIDINIPEIKDDYYQEQTELCSIIDDVIEQPDVFYRMVGEQLTSKESLYIKSLISKSCDTCSNSCCTLEQKDKTVSNCVAWENNRIIGQYKVLKLNKKRVIIIDK